MASLAQQLYEDFLDLTRSASEQFVIAGLQLPYITRKITNYTGFGKDGGILDFTSRGEYGGPTDDGVEVVYLFDRPLAVRVRDKTSQNPLKHVNDLKITPSNPFDVKGLNTNGYFVTLDKLRRDQSYEQLGSLGELTNEDDDVLQDKSTVYSIIQTMDADFTTTQLKRRKLKNPDGTDSDYEVVDVPKSRGINGYLRILDPRGYDLKRMAFHTTFAWIYKALDKFIFNPLVEYPITKLNKKLEEITGRRNQLSPDGYINAEAAAVNRINRKLWGVEEKLEDLGNDRLAVYPYS